MNPKYPKTIPVRLMVFVVLILLVVSLTGLTFPARAALGETIRVSVNTSGAQANGRSAFAALSGDGRYIVYESDASNLVSNDTNGAEDIFLYDTSTKVTSRVSISSSAVEANGASQSPAISSNGQIVLFSSYADNLISGDTNDKIDIFAHDRQTGVTTRVSVASNGDQANDNSSDFKNAISGDGHYAAFVSDATNLVENDTNGVADVFVHDLVTGETTRVSIGSGGTQANLSSSLPSISDDGRYVAFSSSDPTLVSGDTNNKTDIFVHDRQTGTTSRVSVSSSGEEADDDCNSPFISGDGRYVAFSSAAENLVPGYIWEEYIYIHDRQTEQTTRESLFTDGSHMIGVAGNPVISQDGRFVAFDFDDKGDGTGLFEVYTRDRLAGETVLASVPMTGMHPIDENDSSYYPAISADGRFVAFQSIFTGMVTNDTNEEMDVFANEVFFSNLYPKVVKYFRSAGANDGWILESSEESGLGGKRNAETTTLYLGDDAWDREYRAILHFPTHYLPDNAVITKATLKIKKQGLVGNDNPFTTLGRLRVDMRRPFFGPTVKLLIGDFNTAAGFSNVAVFSINSINNWHIAILNATGRNNINKIGTTQFRLFFENGDNDDMSYDYAKFYSGDHDELANRPRLYVEYYVPR